MRKINAVVVMCAVLYEHAHVTAHQSDFATGICILTHVNLKYLVAISKYSSPAKCEKFLNDDCKYNWIARVLNQYLLGVRLNCQVRKIKHNTHRLEACSIL